MQTGEPFRLDPAIKLWIRPLVLYGPWVLLAVGLLLQLAAPQHMVRIGPYVLVCAIVIGLPHGGLDHLVPGFLGRAMTGARVAVFMALYLALSLCVALLWIWNAFLAFLLFTSISVYHFGAADRYCLEQYLGVKRQSRLSFWVTVLARGMVPIHWAAIMDPQAADLFFIRLAGAALGAGGQAPIGSIYSPGAWYALQALIGLLLLLYLWRARVESPNHIIFLMDVFELLLLYIFFALSASYYFSFGVYFIAHHGLRHLIRLSTLDPKVREKLKQRAGFSAAGRLCIAVAPLSAVSLLVLAALGSFGAARGSVEDQLYLYLFVLSTVTVPHTLLVSWMDEKERWLWKSGDQRPAYF